MKLCFLKNKIKEALIKQYQIIRLYNIIRQLFSGNFLALIKAFFRGEVCHMAHFERYIDGSRETFFGYYDKSPLNPTGKYVLYHSSYYSTKKTPKPSKPIDLVVYDKAEKKIIMRFPIYSYNWQQGCRPQWISDYCFIHNNYDCVKEIYFSAIVNVVTKEVKIVNTPIYEAATDFALSVNFRRLAALRPDYGYFNLPEVIPPNEQDGIFYVDYASNKVCLQLSFSEILEKYPIKADFSKKIIAQKVNHVMLSPNKKRYVFLHRFFVESFTNKFDRLFIYDLENSQFALLVDEKMISHYSWINDSSLIVYMRFNNEESYFILKIKDLHFDSIQSFSINVSYGDGHPTIKNNVFMSDSYPQKDFCQHLFFSDINNGTIIKDVKMLHLPFFYGQSRCDIHPKWSSIENEFFIDSVFSGKRYLYSGLLK